MSLTAFPEPKDLEVDFINRTGDSRPKSFVEHGVANPHPGFGKDSNIGNEFGHTKFPMWVDSKIAKERIIVNNEMELAQHTAEPVEAPVTDTTARSADKLQTGGPTLETWLADGYKAKDYPPKGYASNSSEEKIKAAIEAEK